MESIESLAHRWIDTHSSNEAQAFLRQAVGAWASRPNRGAIELWARFVETARLLNCRDLEVSAGRQVLNVEPNNPYAKLLLADALSNQGKPSEAIRLLSGMNKSGIVKYEALIRLLKIDKREAKRQAYCEALAAALVPDGNWTTRYHGAFIEALVDSGLADAARNFFLDWLRSWPNIQAESILNIAAAAALVGLPHLARPMFVQIWPALVEGYLGPFEGSIAAYTPEIEQKLLDRIAAAFATDCGDPPFAERSSDDAAPIGARFMMVSFEHHAVPNDLAEHFRGSALEASVNFTCHLDDALAYPDMFRGSDEESQSRLRALTNHLEKIRPDYLILDCQPALGLNMLNPTVMVALRRQFGFKLVCMFRDAHKYNLKSVETWLTCADSAILFDPGSLILGEQYSPQNRKIVVMPVPAMHRMFLDRKEGTREFGLAFAGSIFFWGRRALLSILMTEAIPFHPVFGARRPLETPDMASYAKLLQRSAAVLNISAHGLDAHLVTGRVWETIAAGSLLIEQDNPATAKFFMPYRHYLPWRTVHDIVHAALFVQNRPDQAERIAAAAREWAGRHYGASAFWQRLWRHVSRAPEAGHAISGDERVEWPILSNKGTLEPFRDTLERLLTA